MTKDDFEKEPLKEIRPPWIVYPKFPPGDSFWKYGGESYMNTAFRPFWKSLNAHDKKEYFTRWNVPENWSIELDPDVDPELRKFLDELDTE